MRRPVVSRAFKSMRVTFLCVNTNTNECEEQVFILDGVEKNDNKLLKMAQKQLNSDAYKVVSVKDKTIEQTLYSMPEEKFKSLADICDLATRRPITD